MDDSRFDQLARAISGAAESRRDTLRVVAGGTAAAVLGVFGVAQSESETQAAKDDKKHKNRHRRKRNNKKNTKICHCDSNGNNCKTLKLTKKNANKHLNKHARDRKGSCDKCMDTDSSCNVNRPGQCCSNNCCFDSTSDTDGTCPTTGGNCCGLTSTGGYCTTDFPQCCGEQACCQNNWVCCSNFRLPNGYCCPPGNVCDFNTPNGCQPDGGAARSTLIGASQPRGRARNR